MEESGLDKKVARVEKMLSLEQVNTILQSPETFIAWVAQASFEDFSFLLSGINYTLYAHIGTPEDSIDEIKRGTKKGLNLFMHYEYDESRNQVHRLVTFVPPRGKELATLFKNVFTRFQSLMSTHKFSEAGELLSRAIILLQPFPDGNKRTARAVKILLERVHTGKMPDITTLVKEKFFSPKTISPDIYTDIDSAANTYAGALRAIQHLFLERQGLAHMYDSREDAAPLAEWDYYKISLPDARWDLETYMHLSYTEAEYLSFELRGIVSLYNEDLPTQIAPVIAFDTLEAFPEYSLRAHVETYHDGMIPVINVPLFIRTLLNSLNEPLSVRMLTHFIETFRRMRDDALTIALHLD